MAAIEDETLLQATTDSDFGFGPTPKGLAGLALVGSSLGLMRGQTPGGVRRLVADYASNRLPTFYSGGKANQYWQYAKELAKTGGRIGGDATFRQLNSEFYNRTGISPVIMRDIDVMDAKKFSAKEAYLSGKVDLKTAKGIIADGQKQIWFKATSDKANQLIFLGKSSSELEKIVGDNVKLSNKLEFLKANNGNSKLADYVMSRQTPLVKQGINFSNIGNLSFIKYSRKNFSNVLRAAQFDPRMYRVMLDLKNYGATGNPIGLIPKAFNPKFISDTKIAFSLSPQFKPNWDWGGFNAVAVWDSKKAGKIRFIATDVPDTPLPGSRGKVPGLKYVDSSEIKITEKNLKETLTGEKDPARVAAGKKAAETRRQKEGWGAYKKRSASDLRTNPIFGESTYARLKDLQSKRKSFALNKVKRLTKFGRRIPGALGLALTAWSLYDLYKGNE